MLIRRSSRSKGGYKGVKYYYIEKKDLLIVVIETTACINLFEKTKELEEQIKKTSGIENVLIVRGEFKVIN